MESQIIIDKHEVSCRTINTIIKYAQYKGVDIDTLLNELPWDEKYLTDTNNWVSRELSDEISRRLRVMFDDDEIMYKVALASDKLYGFGFLDYVARLIGNPKLLIKHASVLNKYFSRVDEIEVLEYKSSSAIVKYYSRPGYEMTMDDCYYTKGMIQILPNIWGLDNIKVWEEACSVPIHKKGRINGKYYTIDEKDYVYEHDVMEERLGKDKPLAIGRLNADGTFKLGDTIYGSQSCLYHISWSTKRMWFKKIFYEFFIKPKVLSDTIDEMERENDLIAQKYEELYQKNLELQQHYIDTINAFIRAIDAKDHYTQDHSLNVAHIAEVLAKELGLAKKKIEYIRQACKLHDLGKIGIKDSILLKPGKLTNEEWEEIKKHPILGAEIIRPLTFLTEVALLIRQDHERWDGAGYPDGLKGEDIDIGSRIIAVADAYDAMVSGRVYKKAMDKNKAIEEIRKNSGTQFDPKVVEVFLKYLAK